MELPICQYVLVMLKWRKTKIKTLIRQHLKEAEGLVVYIWIADREGA